MFSQCTFIKAVFGDNSVLLRLQNLKLLHIELDLIVGLPVNSALELPHRLIKVIIIEDELNSKVSECLPVECLGIE
jgi:hypothetical protein